MTAEMLVYCEKRDVLGQLLSGAGALASELGLIVSAAVLADAEGADVGQWFRYGAERVYVGCHPHLADGEVERVAEALYQIMDGKSVSVVLIGSTRRGKELAGRLAQKLEAGCVSDATSLVVQDGNLVAQRWALGGKTVCAQAIKTEIQVFAIRPGTFEATAADNVGSEIVPVTLNLEPPRVRVVERSVKDLESVDLEQADVVVAAGRGLQSKEDLSIPQALADALGGELGCTRSLCSDCGWLSEERMIGISGKSCSPRLHISVGVSGQIQHAVGIQGSKIIVAINKDRSAPIFSMADYGIVGDLYDVVPKLVAQLDR